jgi:RNA polymerase sigma-70 factor (ECF subfamily)
MAMASLPGMRFQHAISGVAPGSQNNGRLGPLDLTETSDEELMRLVQTRDQGAFARLMDRHLTSIHSYVYRMTRSPTDAEDIAQETFLRLWHRASTFRPGRVQLTTWLHRIAHNLCVDEFRKPTSIVDGKLDEMPNDSLPASTQRLAQERLQAVYSALHTLPERQRSALLLCQLHGWSNKQAAEMMDISVDALESLIARARQTLKTRLRHLIDF